MYKAYHQLVCSQNMDLMVRSMHAGLIKCHGRKLSQSVLLDFLYPLFMAGSCSTKMLNISPIWNLDRTKIMTKYLWCCRYDVIAQLCHAKRLAGKFYPSARMVELHGGHLVSHERTEEVPTEHLKNCCLFYIHFVASAHFINNSNT